MSDIIRFTTPKAVTEVDQLLRIIQPAVDDIGKLVSAQLIPFIRSVDKRDYILDIVYAPAHRLIQVLKDLKESDSFLSIGEQQLRSFRGFLEGCLDQHGTTVLYWLHEGQCHQFHFIHTAAGNYTLFAVWVDGYNLFETALDQAVVNFNTTREELINNPFR